MTFLINVKYTEKKVYFSVKFGNDSSEVMENEKRMIKMQIAVKINISKKLFNIIIFC